MSGSIAFKTIRSLPAGSYGCLSTSLKVYRVVLEAWRLLRQPHFSRVAVKAPDTVANQLISDDRGESPTASRSNFSPILLRRSKMVVAFDEVRELAL